MFNPTSSLCHARSNIPLIRRSRGKVIFEIGVILAVHLALAVAVATVLQAFGEF